ncbi:diaminopimelate epimerase [Pseudomonas cremoricolorata]|uniref:diaminopimelate epimerase n=1 Tax=Pseudomonas cremoricolorata TaxID=157783 RepID=UPI0004015B23|nr:diaminopimelate epimerase [Pseudomonas cremoricolorata]
MLLRFTKMHGLGNDFMVLDLVSQHAHIQPKHARQWGDRNTGVGFDQLLIVEAPSNPDVDFRYRIFNADGSEVEQCGNGARCFARFVLDKRLTAKKLIRVETKGGIIELDVQSDGQVCVDMGPPRLVPADIPFVADAQALSYALEVDGQAYPIAAVSMGNPHAVLRVEDVTSAPVHDLGPKIEHHPRFPQRVNAGFIQVLDRHHARLRVWERGAGETQACGTGACAAAVAAISQGWMDSPVHLDLPGGRLHIEWSGPGMPVRMTGPAVRVYEGQVRL